jgi:hypothetical protein
MSVNPPEPPALQSVQSADALYGRVVTRGRRLRRERWAFLATAGTAVVLLAAAVPIALSSDGGERVATTDRPHTTRPAPTTTSTTSPLTTEPVAPTTEPVTPSTAAPAVVPVRTTTTRRPTATTAPHSTVTSRPAATTTTQPPAPTTTVPNTGAATNCTETRPLVAGGPSGVVFVRNGDIWSSTGDETTATNLTATPDDTEQAPAYSPDRTRIVFVRNGGLFVIPATGGVASPLTQVFTNDSAPAWSRDGGLIAFVRGGDIWLVSSTPNPNGSDAIKAIDVPDPLGNPTWSPDGCRLAFTWRGAVLTARTDGTGMVKVRDAVAEPSWWLNGRIAVSTIQGGTTREIWTILPNGSGFERLTTGGGSNPVWSSANDNVVAFQGSRTTTNVDIYTIPYPSPSGDITRITADAASDTDPTY